MGKLEVAICDLSLWGGRRKLPYAFTEHGVLMLSSVLNSQRAIAMNIRIMRVYVRIREIMHTNTDLVAKINALDGKVAGQDEKFSGCSITCINSMRKKKHRAEKSGINERLVPWNSH